MCIHKTFFYSLFPRGIIDKIASRYFVIEQILYAKPSFRFNIFTRFSRYMSKNEWFGNYVVYMMRRKEFIPLRPKRL